jgi:hypothetical protein
MVIFLLFIVVALFFFFRKKFPTIIGKKSSFWDTQPVKHSNHNVLKPYIINEQLPSQNEFYDGLIETIRGDQLEQNKQEICDMIGQHYLNNADNIYKPTVDELFANYTKDSLISLSYDNNKLIGVIASSVLFFHNTEHNYYIKPRGYDDAKTSKPVNKINYVDFMCVHTDYRKRNIAPRLIYTHYYKQRYMLDDVMISLFKREDELLDSVVPLCSYITKGYFVDEQIERDTSEISMVVRVNEIPKECMEGHYAIQVYPNNWKSHILLRYTPTETSNKVKKYAYYVFKDESIFVRKGIKVLRLMASIVSDVYAYPEILNEGFIHCLKFLKPKYIAIENITTNCYLKIPSFLKEDIQSKTAYYLYNFMCNDVIPELAFICN